MRRDICDTKDCLGGAMLSAEARAQRLVRIFSRTGGEGPSTREFGHFPEDVRTRLVESASVHAGELPVIAFCRSPGEWLLVTTERVVLDRGHGVTSIRWEEVEDATTDAAHVGVALGSGAQGKLALSWLRIQRRTGEDIVMEVESGPAFFGLWNVLKTVAALRKA
ncbi:hypothetical protein JGU66_22475 [Myxococcaceae bacterium JPH2]|nr:hypothetical protein [Myxococcaceae bacterium JPH2]